MARLTGEADVIIGVDTHLDSHTAAACSTTGRQLALTQIPATPAGYAQVLAWARAAAGGGRVAWAMEGTRSYGAGLARYLAAEGEQVTEIDGSRHLGKRRAGKSDAIDAVRAARELLARPHPAQMRADGEREALRLLLIGRDHAVQAAKAARTALASILVTAPAPLREQLRRLPAKRRPAACAAWQCPPGADRVTATTCQVLASLGQRVTALTAEAAHAEAQIAAEHGVGALTAARILLGWSHPGRIRSEAAFAMLSGSAPVPVSSGRTSRHRLNRLGDRQLNCALHTIALTRMRSHPATLAYVARRRAEGKTDREIRRCLKRYLARHLYRELNRRARPAT